MSRILLVALMLTIPALFSCSISEGAKKQASYHYQMGLSHLGENNLVSALVELTAAEKINPNDPDLLNALGYAYFLKNRHEIAEQKYLKALEIRPMFSEVRNKLGVNYLEMKRWDDAIRQFKIVTEDIFFQGQDTAVVNLGIAYLGKGDYQQALTILRAAVSTNPRDPGARRHLGRVYQAMDKMELAITEYRKAIELNMLYSNAYFDLANAYLKVKDNKGALAAFKEVVRIAPDSEIGQLSKEYLDLLK
jgi:Tfp pilus assembly protein PilF